MYLTEVPGATLGSGKRDLIVELVYEYGSRAGFWRLIRFLEEHDIKVTVFGAALALKRNREARARRDAQKPCIPLLDEFVGAMRPNVDGTRGS